MLLIPFSGVLGVYLLLFSPKHMNEPNRFASIKEIKMNKMPKKKKKLEMFFCVEDFKFKFNGVAYQQQHKRSIFCYCGLIFLHFEQLRSVRLSHLIIEHFNKKKIQFLDTNAVDSANSTTMVKPVELFGTWNNHLVYNHSFIGDFILKITTSYPYFDWSFKLSNERQIMQYRFVECILIEQLKL